MLLFTEFGLESRDNVKQFVDNASIFEVGQGQDSRLNYFFRNNGLGYAMFVVSGMKSCSRFQPALSLCRLS